MSTPLEENSTLIAEAQELAKKLPDASGGTDISLGVTGASVGDIIKVKAVDSTGKPTAWEAAEMPGMRLIKSITIEEAVAGIASFNTDDNGQPFDLNVVRVIVTNMFNSTILRIFISPNNTAVVSDRGYYYFSGAPLIEIAPDTSIGCGSVTIDLRKKAVETINAKSANVGLTTSFGVQPANTQHELIVRSIIIGTNNSSNLIPADTKIEVWGIDA